MTKPKAAGAAKAPAGTDAPIAGAATTSPAGGDAAEQDAPTGSGAAPGLPSAAPAAAPAAGETDPRADLGELVHVQPVSEEDAARILSERAELETQFEAFAGDVVVGRTRDLEFQRLLGRLTADELSMLFRLLTKIGAPIDVIEEFFVATEAPEPLPDLEGKVLKVASVSKNGRRRAGQAFTPTPTPIAPGGLSDDQIAALLTDPELIVSIETE